MYPAATNSFREAGTRRCSTLNLRSACVSSAKTFASPASDGTAEVSAFGGADAAGGGEGLLPQPMQNNETAQVKKRRGGIEVVCLRAFQRQVVSFASNRKTNPNMLSICSYVFGGRA